MPFAVELYLDEDADRRVREVWEMLDGEGIRSLGSQPGTDYHPHVSLAAFGEVDIERVVPALRDALRDVLGVPLPFAGVGFFLTDESPLFLSVVPSSALLEAHRRVYAALERVASGYWPYLPDALLPHCTLAMGIADRAAAVDAMTRVELPTVASVGSAHLVEIPGGTSRAQIA
jgi:2'-5' RNA ligase